MKRLIDGEGVLVALVGLVLGGMQLPCSALEDFALYDGTKAVPILIDSSYGGPHDDRSYQQVHRAVQDLRQDVAMVAGAIAPREVQALFVDDDTKQQQRLAHADQKKVPALMQAAKEVPSAIIIGVIGQSALVDSIIAAGKFDEAKAITGKWEAYAIKRVASPIAGLGNALVIAGSDARGTIYGIYSISEAIGVSPWYWFADVPVRQRSKIAVDGALRVNKGPDVQFRGFFINDEERMVDWAKAKFPTGKGTPDVNYYRHVFEFMLRVRLNTLWPAMHEHTTAFNAATATGMHDSGTPINAKEAAAFGIIMSSSHPEPMLRNNVDEWPEFFRRNRQALNMKGKTYKQAYDYSINKPALLAYWRERLQANAAFECIPVLGIRGVHDSNPKFSSNNPYGFANAIAMVADAIKEQRKLIETIYGSLEAVPQVFIPYKEMNKLYNAGLKKHIPEDVILMWANDNYGHLRQVPTTAERARSGGNGIYIHCSYWGSPKSYLWLNSTPMPLLTQQLRRAWHAGAGRFWIMNVGDIKPGEMKLEMFSKLAWTVDEKYESDLERQYLRELVERDFNVRGELSDAVVNALVRFTRLETVKRAEFFGTSNPGGVHSTAFSSDKSFPPSPTSAGDELQRFINEANDLVRILENVSNGLDEAYRPAFRLLILHRVSSWRNMAEQFGYFWKHQLAAKQSRFGSAEVYATLSKRARDRIRSEEQLWNRLSDGKWEKAIGYSHPITYYGGINEGVVMLADDRYASVTNPASGVGASAEGSETAGSGTLRFNSSSPKDERFFDVFASGSGSYAWQAETDAPWIKLSQKSGTTRTEQRIVVTVDWAQRNAGNDGKIMVFNVTGGKKTGDAVATFSVVALRSAIDFGSDRGHLEANGYVAIEADHFAKHVPGSDGSEWRVQKRMGRKGNAMMACPETAPRVDAEFAETAQLKYRIYFTSAGTFPGNLYRIPTLNEGSNDDGSARTCRIAIGLDDTIPTSANLRGQSEVKGEWGSNIMRQSEPLGFKLTVPKSGWHDLIVYRSDAAMVFERIVIETIPGAAGNALTGPVESPNTIAQTDAAMGARVATLPPELLNQNDNGGK